MSYSNRGITSPRRFDAELVRDLGREWDR